MVYLAGGAALALLAGVASVGGMAERLMSDGFTQGFRQNDRQSDVDAFAAGAPRQAAQAIADGDDTALKAVLSASPEVASSFAGDIDLLILAMAHRNRNAFEALMEAGASPDGAGKYAPIAYSIEMTDDWWLDRLIALRADPDGTAPNGMEALDRAILEQTEDRALKLVAAGADPKLDTGGGNTYAHEAAIVNRFNVVEALMEKGADMWATSGIGVTPAYLVTNPSRATTGNPEVLEPARQRLLARLKETGPEWPPSSPEEVRDRVKAGTWLRPVN